MLMVKIGRSNLKSAGGCGWSFRGRPNGAREISRKKSSRSHKRGAAVHRSIDARVDAFSEADVLCSMADRSASGTKKVKLVLDGGASVEAEIVVAPVGGDILSMGKLLRQGFRFDRSERDGYTMSKGWPERATLH